jgi:hypothetical protein
VDDSCPHDVVLGRTDTVPLFGDDTMPVDKWECKACKKAFRPRIKTPAEKLQDWWTVIKLRRELKRFRG